MYNIYTNFHQNLRWSSGEPCTTWRGMAHIYFINVFQYRLSIAHQYFLGAHKLRSVGLGIFVDVAVPFVGQPGVFPPPNFEEQRAPQTDENRDERRQGVVEGFVENLRIHACRVVAVISVHYYMFQVVLLWYLKFAMILIFWYLKTLILIIAN